MFHVKHPGFGQLLFPLPPPRLNPCSIAMSHPTEVLHLRARGPVYEAGAGGRLPHPSDSAGTIRSRPAPGSRGPGRMQRTS